VRQGRADPLPPGDDEYQIECDQNHQHRSGRVEVTADKGLVEGETAQTYVWTRTNGQAATI
jgi:hypothetical protein